MTVYTFGEIKYDSDSDNYIDYDILYKSLIAVSVISFLSILVLAGIIYMYKELEEDYKKLYLILIGFSICLFNFLPTTISYHVFHSKIDDDDAQDYFDVFNWVWIVMISLSLLLVIGLAIYEYKKKGS